VDMAAGAAAALVAVASAGDSASDLVGAGAAGGVQVGASGVQHGVGTRIGIHTGTAPDGAGIIMITAIPPPMTT